MNTTTAETTEETTLDLITITRITTTPVPTTCPFCCFFGIIVVVICMITNIPIVIIWARRRLLNCISIFFVAFAVNFILLAIYTLMYIIVDTCIGFDNAIFKYVYVAVCFLIYSNCCLLTALMACYHCLMRVHKIQWELWTKLTAVQAVAASAALSLVIGFANLVFSGVLLPGETGEIKPAAPSIVDFSGDLLFTLWFYGLIRIGSSVVVTICTIISLKTEPPPSAEPSLINVGEETDDVIGPQMMERQDKFMKSISGHRVDPNKIVSDQIRSKYSFQGDSKIRKSKVIQEAHSANMSIREAIMRQAIREYVEKRKGREYNIGYHNDEPDAIDQETSKLEEKQEVVKKAQQSSTLRYRQTKHENEDIYSYSVFTVSILFVILELPVGILCFISSKVEYYMDIFKMLAVYLDMLPFIRNSLHVFIYAIFCEKFRKGFLRSS